MRNIKSATRTTKFVIAAVVASIAFAGVYGFAASLGLGSSGLSAGNAVVATCGSGMQAAYTTAYAAALPGYSVSQINLSSIPAGCLNKSYKIQLTGAAGATVGPELTGSLPAAGTTYNVPTGATVDASAVTGISVVVS